jgi:hypothetical protein
MKSLFMIKCTIFEGFIVSKKFKAPSLLNFKNVKTSQIKIGLILKFPKEKI